ncbi:MAG: holo-ACP synthase [Bacillota bacterium]
MMYRGFGIAVMPLVETARIMKTWGKSSLYRLLTARERAYCGRGSVGRPLERIAGRMAAKKAVLKALGIAEGDPGLLTEVEILPDFRGKPLVVLHGRLREVLSSCKGSDVQVSISHGDEVALAIALLF